MPFVQNIGSGKLYAVSESNITAGTHYEYITFYSFSNFTIHTLTLTNMTVTIEASLDGTDYLDVTNTLFGVSSLSSNTAYIADTTMTFMDLRIAYARTNATNAVNFQVMVKEGA